MYRQFFGFRERPFQLVPNPDYLFLTKSHEEALAHLTFAVAQGDGFVEITGEVGTGKTTLCRTFLENLDEETEVAYIFNPRMNSVELIKAINDEFGIDSSPNNIKELIDALNFFLLRKKSQNKKIILLIDEAQNLSSEVLEQLRLLSNLETSTSKLLQIILVGQPELSETLDSYELRQLGQRITLSCHISPMSSKEMRDYVRHRIGIASNKPVVRFSNAALNAIHKFSGGIPRLVNIACERALLTAFGLNKKKITGNIAKTAIRELTSRGDIRRFTFEESKRGYFALGMLGLLFALVIFYFPRNLNMDWLFAKIEGEKPVSVISKKAPDSKQPDVKIMLGDSEKPAAMVVKPQPEIEKKEPAKAAEKPVPVTKTIVANTEKKTDGKEQPGKTVYELEDYFRTMDFAGSGESAMETVLALWGEDAAKHPITNPPKTVPELFDRMAKNHKLTIYKIEDKLDLLKTLDLPAILEMHSPEKTNPGYLALVKIGNDNFVHFQDREKNTIRINASDLRFYWLDGVAYIPWRNFYACEGIIPRSATKDSILALKKMLTDAGYKDVDLKNDTYDVLTRGLIQGIQHKNGVKVDGTVGPLTKIMLYNELKSLEIPHIVKN